MLKEVYNICLHKFSAVGQITTLERLGTTNPWYDPKEGSFIALYIILLLLLCLTSLPLFLLFYLYQILQWASCLSPSMKPLVIPLSPHLSVCVCPHHLSVCHLRCWFPDRPQGCHGIAVVMEPVSEETSVTILKFWLYFSKLIQVISFPLQKVCQYSKLWFSMNLALKSRCARLCEAKTILMLLVKLLTKVFIVNSCNFADLWPDFTSYVSRNYGHKAKAKQCWL